MMVGFAASRGTARTRAVSVAHSASRFARETAGTFSATTDSATAAAAGVLTRDASIDSNTAIANSRDTAASTAQQAAARWRPAVAK